MAMLSIRPVLMPDHAARPLWGQRLGVGVLVAVLHGLVILALVRGLAGGVVIAVPDASLVLAAFVPDTPPPKSTPPPPPPASHAPSGAAGAMAVRARPKALAAPPPRLVVPAPLAAPVAADGSATHSGAGTSGAGTGGSGAGAGPGSGGSGDGMGAGVIARKAVKIAGDITATRDYPAAGRDARAGRQVVVVLRVGTDGRVSGCRVHQPSGNAEADAITCRLAVERFRFQPALDGAGQPVASDYGWQQRWWEP